MEKMDYSSVNACFSFHMIHQILLLLSRATEKRWSRTEYLAQGDADFAAALIFWSALFLGIWIISHAGQRGTSLILLAV